MRIRKSVCEGTWYDSDPDVLRGKISKYLEGASGCEKSAKIVIVPHAGHSFSGRIATKGLACISEDVKKVVILGTSHHYPLLGASIVQADAYETPLGNVKICEEIDKEGLVNVPQAHEREHSIEIELPFLQIILEDFCIIPLLVGKVSEDFFVRKLKDFEDSVFVVSVDLSHFHTYKDAKELDKRTIDCVMKLDYEGIKECEVDSPYALASILKFAKEKGYEPELVEYKNSGDITGEKTSVVGYAAIIMR